MRNRSQPPSINVIIFLQLCNPLVWITTANWRCRKPFNQTVHSLCLYKSYICAALVYLLKTASDRYSHCINSLCSSDAIWRHESGSTVTQIMVSSLAAPSITWANVDLSSVKSTDNHMRTITQEIPVFNIGNKLENDLLKFRQNYPRS